MRCPECNKADLFHFEEILVEKRRKIKSDNTIGDKPYKVTSEGMNEHGVYPGLQCNECNTIFDFETDSAGRIIYVKKRT
jgi:hypothetical protein